MSRGNIYQLLDKCLLAKTEYQPIARIDDRSWWEGSIPTAARLDICNNAGLSACIDWPHLTASNYLNFKRNGNRTHYEQPYFKRRKILWSLAIGECVENKGSYLDHIANAIWSICEESSWCVAAHNAAYGNDSGLPIIEKPVIDLFAAETSAILSYVYFMLKSRLDEVSPVISQRIENEIVKRIIEPFLSRDDFWWMGINGRKVNNWNPWILSNIIPSILLIEEDHSLRVTGMQKC
ncbi:MAG: heparinase, partial [Spirochaetota bacterium]